MNAILTPNAVSVMFSDAGANRLQLSAFSEVLKKELDARYPLADLTVAYEYGVDAPVVAKVDGSVSKQVSALAHRLYGLFATSPLFGSLA